MRGCITSGEQWAFFVYKSDSAGGVVSIASEISLGTALENFPLVVGLLRDMVCYPLQTFFFFFSVTEYSMQVENALIYEQKYFSY